MRWKLLEKWWKLFRFFLSKKLNGLKSSKMRFKISNEASAPTHSTIQKSNLVKFQILSKENIYAMRKFCSSSQTGDQITLKLPGNVSLQNFTSILMSDIFFNSKIFDQKKYFWKICFFESFITFIKGNDIFPLIKSEIWPNSIFEWSSSSVRRPRSKF